MGNDGSVWISADDDPSLAVICLRLMPSCTPSRPLRIRTAFISRRAQPTAPTMWSTSAWP